jgi:hypothetical protein
MISLGLASSRVVFTALTGMFGRLVPVLPTVLFLLALPTAVMAATQYGRVERPAHRNYFVLAGLVLLAMLVRGALSDFVSRTVWSECFMFTLTLTYLYLGQFEQAWRDIVPYLWVYCPAAAVLTLVALRYESFTIYLQEGLFQTGNVQTSRWAVRTLAYQLNWAMSLWPLAFALAAMRRRMGWAVISGFLAAAVFVYLQIEFQKRAPSLRALVYVISVVFITWRARHHVPMRLYGFLAAGALVVLAWIVKTENFSLLVERFQSEELRRGDGRTYEIGEMLAGFSIGDWLIGRGLGGYFFIERWSAGMADVTERGDIGRHIVHLGFFYLLLKGGILFTLIYFRFAFRVLRHHSRLWLQNPHNAAALAVLPVYLIFQFAEGPPSYANPLEAVLFGLVCGRFIHLRPRAPVPETHPAGRPMEAYRV